MAPKNLEDDNLPLKEEVSPPSPEPEVKLPKRIRVTHYYAYYDEVGRYRDWKAGDVIVSADELKLLVERKAPYVVEE